MSPQAIKIYKVLSKGRPLSAKEIGKRLGIFPNAVYRSAQILVAQGIVQPLPTYPITYQALPQHQAMAQYASTAQQDFQNIFGIAEQLTEGKNLLQLNFMQSRKERLALIYKDTARAKNTINLIASGLEVPAEVILAYKRAIDRGVKIRILVQNLDEVRAEMFRNWQKIGVEVKYFPAIEARIYIFDGKVLYLTSYHPNDKQEGVGLRFAYAPCAKLMDEMFERRWATGKIISK
jgi:sugar-specific transcriptional regulator TrmB